MGNNKYKHTSKGRYTKYKSDAKRRKLTFGLTLAEFTMFTGMPCFYCGANDEPSGLDRIENDCGYQRDNVVPCCYKCNMMRGSLTQAEFFTQVTHIYEVVAWNLQRAYELACKQQQANVPASENFTYVATDVGASVTDVGDMCNVDNGGGE